MKLLSRDDFDRSFLLGKRDIKPMDLHNAKDILILIVNFIVVYLCFVWLPLKKLHLQKSSLGNSAKAYKSGYKRRLRELTSTKKFQVSLKQTVSYTRLMVMVLSVWVYATNVLLSHGKYTLMEDFLILAFFILLCAAIDEQLRNLTVLFTDEDSVYNKWKSNYAEVVGALFSHAVEQLPVKDKDALAEEATPDISDTVVKGANLKLPVSEDDSDVADSAMTTEFLGRREYAKLKAQNKVHNNGRSADDQKVSKMIKYQAIEDTEDLEDDDSLEVYEEGTNQDESAPYGIKNFTPDDLTLHGENFILENYKRDLNNSYNSDQVYKYMKLLLAGDENSFNPVINLKTGTKFIDTTKLGLAILDAYAETADKYRDINAIDLDTDSTSGNQFTDGSTNIIDIIKQVNNFGIPLDDEDLDRINEQLPYNYLDELMYLMELLETTNRELHGADGSPVAEYTADGKATDNSKGSHFDFGDLNAQKSLSLASALLWAYPYVSERVVSNERTQYALGNSKLSILMLILGYSFML